MLVVDIEKQLGDWGLRVSFETKKEVLSLLGASGSGKSMTLKCIAGIEQPDAGRIVLNDCVLFDSEKGINLPPQKRRVGYLFQQYALFPNMTVAQNIEVALHHLPKSQRKIALEQVIKDFHLEGLSQRKPVQLSGGEQQRTALARIMASEPELLLLDEPFSALDRHLKWQMLLDMKKMLQGFEKDILFVTHNTDEVFGLSDSLCVLNHGCSEEILKVEDAKEHPMTVGAAKLFGCKNFSRVKIEKKLIQCMDWGISLIVDAAKVLQDDNLMVGVYSKDIEVCRKENTKDMDNHISCTVSQIIPTEHSKNIVLKIENKEAYLCAKSDFELEINEQVSVSISPDNLLFLKAE